MEQKEALIKEFIKESQIKHIAIIMDGNGRWAKAQGHERSYGHNFGVETVVRIVKRCDELGIKYLSLYAFSTENWKRPKKEVSTIFDLVIKFINREFDNLMKNNVKLVTMGDISKLPLLSRKAIETACSRTVNNTGLVLNIGINYGGRDELATAIKRMARAGVDFENIDENSLKAYLYTADLPDPDLLIRTGGELRISNFMLYQLAYSELYFTEVLWPDFSADDLDRAIEELMHRNRRFGGL